MKKHIQMVVFRRGNFGQDGLLMDDSDGDDIWHVTVSLPENQVGQTKLYKFRNQPSLVPGMVLKILLD